MNSLHPAQHRGQVENCLRTHFILYVEDQGRSTEFYTRVLGREPSLNVPGMTEFELSIRA